MIAEEPAIRSVRHVTQVNGRRPLAAEFRFGSWERSNLDYFSFTSLLPNWSGVKS